MDNPFKSPAILSLCTGMRGLERGIERAIGSIRTVAYVEIEAFIIQNLVGQMEQGVLAPAPIWSNLKTFPSLQFHKKVHGIVGGYPCQPFSVAGQQKGTDDPRHLWPFIKEMVRSVEPIWCFFENVPGHINLGYREVRSDLEGLGYKVEEGIYSAEEVGAPHQRKRIFILAVKLANSEAERLHGDDSEGNISARRCDTKYDKFPSRPNQQQYDWEEPRTIKPGMGYTVNGYNYREDLLRMAGNGVVEQTAELAFIDLLNKHFNN